MNQPFKSDASDNHPAKTRVLQQAPEGGPPVHTNDSGSLESGRDGAVEILLSRDVYFIDDVAVKEHRNLEGNIERLLIQVEWGSVVHFVSAGAAFD